MTNKLFLSFFTSIFILFATSCDHKQEKNEINRNLADAAQYCNLTATDSPEKVYNSANFVQLCAMGGWPTNFDTAKQFRANAAYNNSTMAADILDNASNVAYSINASEILHIINDARSHLQTASKNFELARENRIGMDYDYYINTAMNENNYAIQCIEHARRILYQ